MTELDPRRPVEFEPVSVGRRRRGPDPVRIVVFIAVLGVVTALAKPWDLLSSDGDGTAEVVRPTAAIDTPATPEPSARLGTAVRSEPAAPPAWADIAHVVGQHDAWGVRTIIRTSGRASTGERASYDERWTPVSIDPEAGTRTVLQAGVRTIVGIGVTFPAGSAPLDVRIWRRSPGGVLYWLDARSIARDPAQGGLIFTSPQSDPGSPAWGPGEYRIDLLIGSGTVRRIEFAIPDRYENVRASSVDPPRASELVASSEVDPTTVPVGPFAAIDRVGWPLESVGGAVLDEAQAWLDTEPGSGRAPADRVAVAYLSRATGLGVRLPDGSAVRAATMTRLAPGPFVNVPTPVGGGIIDRRNADPWVMFAARRGDAWAPGVYRIDVSWVDDSGPHQAAWHIELRPGPSTGPPPLLALARAWARHAGGSGIVVGRAEPLEGGPRSSAIRLLPTVGDGVPRGQDGVSAACDGTIVAGTPEAFGLAYPVDQSLDVARVRIDGTGPAARDVPTIQAANVVPGLTLVAPMEGTTFQPGAYRLELGEGAGARTVTVCVGGG